MALTAMWSSDLSLGILSMDTSHKALLDELAQLSVVPDAEFPAHFAAMVAKVESDFREEEDLMENVDFPGTCGHREQHARLLSGLHHAAPRIMGGDIALGRYVAELLSQWFVFHITTMDTAFSISLTLNPSAPAPVESVPSQARG